MIYLKFMVKKEDGSAQRVICTTDYQVMRDDTGIRVYYQPGMWERLSDDDWYNCFVMSESGKTIDRLEAPVAIGAAEDGPVEVSEDMREKVRSAARNVLSDGAIN